MKNFPIPALLACAILGGCAQYQPGYQAAQPEVVRYGTVVSAQFIQIPQNDTMGGALIGGALGAGVGSLINNTNGAIAGGVIGALGGGMVGANQTQNGQLLAVRMTNGQIIDVRVARNYRYSPPYYVGERIELVQSGGRFSIGAAP